MILRRKIVKLALLQHKKPYIYDTYGPDSFDCAGLVWYLYNEICGLNLFKDGYGISTTTKLMTSIYGVLNKFEEADKYKDISVIEKGDIVFFHRQSFKDNEPKIDNRYPGHAGLYLGERKFIHCPQSKGFVVISSFDANPYWLKVLVASKNVLSTDDVIERKKI